MDEMQSRIGGIAVADRPLEEGGNYVRISLQGNGKNDR
jgi:hypothetical protein